MKINDNIDFKFSFIVMNSYIEILKSADDNFENMDSESKQICMDIFSLLKDRSFLDIEYLKKILKQREIFEISKTSYFKL